MSAAHPPSAIDLRLDRCRILDRAGILAVLREILARRALITLHFHEGREFIVTTLLAVDADLEEIVVDWGADLEADRHLLQADRLAAVTFVDHIRIQFATGRARESVHAGAPAFRIRRPDEVLRLQRRNYYRVKVPAGRPVTCAVPDPARPGAFHDLRVLDLSVGGIALIAKVEESDRQPGDVLEGCRIGLPDHGDFEVALAVRSVERLAPVGRRELRRLGCEFLGLPARLAGRVQRYILQVERSRLAGR